MSEVKPYVVTWQGGTYPNDVDLETRITVHGPFDTFESAGDWGREWEVDSGDDPRWQVIMLSNENMQEKYLLVPIFSAV